jgi:hypothetical protein
MATGPPTRQQPLPPPPPPAGSSTGIELTTLFLSAIASAVAAYVVSKIWAPGTLFSAAMTPVIVALVKEGLRRPTEKVADVASTAAAVVPLGWTRSSASDTALVPDPDAPQAPAPEAPVADPDAPHVVLPPVVATDHAPVSVYSTRARRLRWRLAVITGLLGFVVCVLVYTVPELLAGDSIGRHGSSATTIFGGHARRHSSRSKTSTTRTTGTTGTTSTTSTTKTTATTPDQTTTPTTTPQSSASPQSTTAPPATSSATPSSTAPSSGTAPSNVQGAAAPDAVP